MTRHEDAPHTTVTFLGTDAVVPGCGADTASFVINNRYLVDTGWYAAIPWIVAFFFQPAAGWLSDKLIKIGWSTTRSRKTVIVAMNFLATVVVFAAYVKSAEMAVALLTLSLAFESASSVILWTVCAEVAPKNAAASVAGIMNTAGAVAGILAPIVTGFLLKSTGNFEAALVVGGVMFVLASAAMWFVVGPVEMISLEPEKLNRELQV